MVEKNFNVLILANTDWLIAKIAQKQSPNAI